MGFRTNVYATVWDVRPRGDFVTSLQISISRKDKNTGNYVTDFSAWVTAYGSAAAKKAAGLKKQDKIKLGDVDVLSTYDKEKGEQKTNFRIYTFDIADQEGKPVQRTNEPQPTVDSGEVEDSRLPF